MQGEGEVMTASASAQHYAVHIGPEAIRHHFNHLPRKSYVGKSICPRLRLSSKIRLEA
jgi:beta-glucosidase